MRFAALFLIVSMTSAFAVEFRKPAERKPAPAFELKNAAGETVKLADYKGKIVVLDFWATWCIPCKESIPWMNELAARYKPLGVEILGVSMDDEGWKVVKPFIEDAALKYPVVLGTEPVAVLYGDVDALPSAFFIDRAQKIVATHVGGGTRQEFEAVLQKLLKSK